MDGGRRRGRSEQRVQLVVERARALHHGDVLRHARQLGRASGIREAVGEPLGQVRDLGAEHRDEAAGEHGVDDLGQVVLLRRGRARLERGFLAKDRRVELLERRARVDAEPVDERTARALVRLERLRLASGAVEREHQLRPQALAQRMLGDERLELAHELRVPARLELGLDSLLERREPELSEPGDLGLRPGLEAELGERLAPPEVERRS